MSDTLFIGDYSYSSWSLRGWLLFRRFGIDVNIHLVDFSTTGVAEQMAKYAPARTVPTLVTEQGDVLWDSLAIAEEMASRHPDAGLWPNDPSLRALARSLTAEMHSGFGALRGTCPMGLRTAYSGFEPAEDVQKDLARIDELWTLALNTSGGPWLCDTYSVADAFYAPVAARIAGFGLTVSEAAQAYVDRHLHDSAFRRWRAMGFAAGNELPWYAQDLPKAPWPGPAPLPAKAVESGTSINATCPYSGDPVTHLMELDGKAYGFCNAFCRDKTAADPEAWPAFMAIYAP